MSDPKRGKQQRTDKASYIKGGRDKEGEGGGEEERLDEGKTEEQ